MSPPPLLANLFRDLRDRQLLPVVLALAGALVAAPILLSDTSEAPPPDVAAQDAAVDAPEAQAAVVAEVPRVRDYRKRLNAVKQRNPFKQQFLFPDSTASLEDSPTVAGEEGGGSGGGDSSTVESSTSKTTEGGSGSTETEIKLISFKLDVLAGPVGDTREIKNVELLDFLPGKRKPVVEFIAVGLSGKKATFAVSKSVSRATGEGRCLADRSDCDFLLLRVGEAQRLEYDLDGRTYRIKLLKITQVVEDADEPLGAADAKSTQLRAWLGIPD